MFEYGGIKIDFSQANAQFSALIDGKIVRGTSLAGIKKKIDMHKEKKAGAFTGLVRQHGGDELKPVEIVGIAKAKGKYGVSRDDKWKDIHGNEHRIVYKDTPENRERYLAVVEMDRQHAKERDALRDKLNELSQAKWAALDRYELPK